MDEGSLKFSVGQLVYHKLFNYRGVIIDVDPTFQGSESWYQEMAKSKPPKDRPWYHVLPHRTAHQTYVAEQNLESDDTGEPIAHPLLEYVFREFRDGRYVRTDLN
jgi:heat shock protein HspQ